MSYLEMDELTFAKLNLDTLEKEELTILQILAKADVEMAKEKE